MGGGGMFGPNGYGFSDVWSEIGHQFWPLKSQIEYGFYTLTSLELGMFLLEEDTFSSLVIGPSTKALYIAFKIGLN